MSIHSLIHSNIRDVNMLTGILDELGIRWNWEPDVTYKASNQRPENVISAFINGEEVLMTQEFRGSAFVFQSSGWWFRGKNSHRLETLAAEADRSKRKREEVETRKRLQEEQARREQEEGQRREAEEAEARRQVEEAIRQKELDRLEKKRLENLDEEARLVLERFEQRRAAAAVPQATKNGGPPTPSQPAETLDPAVSMESIFGKVHQRNAVNLVEEHVREIQEHSDLYLEEKREEEDGSIVYVFSNR